MLVKIAYFELVGWPLLAILGMTTLGLLLTTAIFPWLRQKGIIKIPFIWHTRLAKLTVVVAIVHAILALSVYL